MDKIVNNDLLDMMDQAMPDVEDKEDGTPTLGETDQAVVEHEEHSAIEESPEVEEEPVEADVQTEDWKSKYEELDKRYRDYQSFNDRERNEQAKKLAELTKVEETPKEEPKPEIDFEKLGDLMIDDPAEAMKQMFALVQNQQQTKQPDLSTVRLQAMEDAMRINHDDYDSVVDLFKHAASINPDLSQQFQSSENKVKFAYEEGKKLMRVQEILKDPVAYEKRIRQEAESEIRKKNTPSTLHGITSTRKTSAPAKNQMSDADELMAGFGLKKG